MVGIASAFKLPLIVPNSHSEFPIAVGYHPKTMSANPSTVNTAPIQLSSDHAAVAFRTHTRWDSASLNGAREASGTMTRMVSITGLSTYRCGRQANTAIDRRRDITTARVDIAPPRRA